MVNDPYYATRTAQVGLKVAFAQQPRGTFSVGMAQACALTAAGGVRCWGSAQFGALGNGVVGTSTTGNSSTPVDVVGLGSGVKSVAVASGYACAVLMSGGMRGWGSHYYGQLCKWTKTDSATPVDVVVV